MSSTPPQFPSRNEIAYLVSSASRLLTLNFMANISVSGLTPAQLYVLRELAGGERLSQSELARNIQVTRASIGETILRLEKAGMVSRAPLDGRSLGATLTPRAAALMDDLVRESHLQNELVSSILSEEEEAQLRSLLMRLIGGVQEQLDARNAQSVRGIDAEALGTS